MILTDTHVHSCYSSDSSANPEDMIQKALDKGFSYFYLTDHMDYDFPIIDGLDFILDVDAYDTLFEQLHKKYQNKIVLRKGIELGVKEDIVGDIINLLDHHSYDFVIHSTHLVNNTDPYQESFWGSMSERDCIFHYFETVHDNLKLFTDFDTCAHLDYVIRHAPSQCKDYSYKLYGDVIDEILKFLINNGKALEVNTGGLRYGLSNPNPHVDILKRYRELGGELLTIGSDAHKPEFYAFQFDKAEALLKKIGFQYYTVFFERKAETLQF